MNRVQKNGDKGKGMIIHSICVSRELDALIEDTRRKISLNRSAFYRYALIRLLEKLSILSHAVHSHEESEEFEEHPNNEDSDLPATR